MFAESVVLDSEWFLQGGHHWIPGHFQEHTKQHEKAEEEWVKWRSSPLPAVFMYRFTTRNPTPSWAQRFNMGLLKSAPDKELAQLLVAPLGSRNHITQNVGDVWPAQI